MISASVSNSQNAPRNGRRWGKGNRTKNPDSKVTGRGPRRCFAFLEIFFLCETLAAGFLFDAIVRDGKIDKTASSTNGGWHNHKKIYLLDSALHFIFFFKLPKEGELRFILLLSLQTGQSSLDYN